jgi:amino acid transporter
MKIMGVFFIIQVIPIVFSIFMATNLNSRSISFFMPAGILFIGLLLVFCSGAIARLIVRPKEDSAISSALSLSDWQTVLFSALGVSTVVHAFRSVSTYFTYPRQEMHGPWLISSIVMTTVGILLFIQARGLANLWQFIQERRAHENEES